MSERKWTPMQKKAIETRDRTLLVSAAAGSGKTATLTERIIKSILDQDEPLNIEDVLIVTFTNAAVGELRERIGEALKQAIRESPDNQRLSRQLLMLPGAKISTIDAFCSEILRANCDRVGVSPQYRIADGAEAEILAESILDGLFEGIYEGRLPEVATPGELENLADCLTETRSQGDLAINLRLIYKQTESTEEGLDTLFALVEEFNTVGYTSVEDTRMGAYLVERVHAMAEHYKRILTEAKNEALDISDPKLMRVLDILGRDLAVLDSMCAADSYNELRRIFLDTKLDNSVSLGKYADILPPITAIRADMKEDISYFAEGVFYCSEADFLTGYKGLYETLGVMMRVLGKFDELFTEEKLRRGICQYSDVERFTCKCLWDNGERTDIAYAEAEKYKAVYIDEYQDVNSLQNKIFEAISRPDNRFMVGDIKQSIYRFRSANPDIFRGMKKTFSPLGTEGDYPCASIFMSENFRCDRGIIDFVNSVFRRLFGLVADSIGYDDADELNYAKRHEGGEPPYRKPELCLIEKELGAAAVANAGIRGVESATPLVVAQKIRELIDTERLDSGEPITPGDIAIIMRNAKGADAEYALALSELGIPSVTAEEKTFFMNPEVLLVLCLLNTIDNPRRDIYLAGLMRSPLFSFSADELALIRAEGKGQSLYESLVDYTEGHKGYTRGEKFIRTIEKYRLFAEGVAVDSLLARLYHETGLMSLAAKNGGKEHLLLLYEHARRFESSSYKGLYNFINYINSILERKSEFDKRSAPKDTDAVKIITAHSSKGLEYPIVFFVGLEQKLKSSRDAQPRLVLDENFGMGMFLRTLSGLGLVENPTKHLVLDYKSRQRIEEEMRVLYVALTRARERLYMVACPKAKYDSVLTDGERMYRYLDGYSVYKLSDYLDMIFSSVGTEHRIVGEFLQSPPPYLVKEFDKDTSAVRQISQASGDLEDTEKSDGGDGEELANLLLSRFRYKYPYEHLTQLPEKMSVSRLYPEILDGTGEDIAPAPRGVGIGDNIDKQGTRLRFAKPGVMPAFAGGGSERLSAKRGIATHLLFQFCDLEKLYTDGAEAELARLLREHYISEKDAALVRLDEVELFRRSSLIERMRSARKLYRELRFNVRMPAELFATEQQAKELYKGEHILVQGVIDCVIEDAEGNLSLVDYKTDRLTPLQLQDPSLAAQKLREAHALQLSYYKEAVAGIFGKEPVSVEVYSLPLGDTVSVI